MFFFICSDSGMTGTDVRVGSCRYLLNQQTLIIFVGDLDTGLVLHLLWILKEKS